MIIPSSQIAAELAELGCQSIQPPRDAEVFCPSVKFMDELGAYFLTDPTAKPIPGKRDCEDMSIKFLDRASDSIVKADKIREGVGHSVGLATVMIPTWLENGDDNPGLNGIVKGTTTGVHMSAIVRCSDNQWYFYEAQTAKKTLAREALDRGIVATFIWAWV